MPVTVTSVAPTCPTANPTIHRVVPSQRSAATPSTSSSTITVTGLLPGSSQNADATSTCNGSRCMLARFVDTLATRCSPNRPLTPRSVHQVTRIVNR